MLQPGGQLTEKQQKENDLGFLVGKMNTSQQDACTAKNANSILGCTMWIIASRSREMLLPFCSALPRYIGVLGPVLGHPVRERNGHTGMTPVQGHRDD